MVSALIQNLNYSCVDKQGVLFADDKRTLLRCPLDFEGEYVVTDTVFRIEDGAFSHCHRLTSLVIPHSVWEIGQGIVSDCKALTSLSFAREFIYSVELDEHAFDDCTNHCTLYVPNRSEAGYRNHPAFKGFQIVVEKQSLSHPDYCFDDYPYDSNDKNRYVYQEPQPYDGDNADRAEAMDYICTGKIEMGRQCLEDLWSKGDLWAGNALVYGYQNGWFGKRNYEIAVGLYRQLCQKGCKWTVSSLGFCYQMGLGIRKNMRCAIKWYQKGVAAGDFYAVSLSANIQGQCKCNTLNTLK